MEGRASDTLDIFGQRAEKLWKLPLCGSRGTIKLQKRFFHGSHIAWKTLRKKQKRGEFPTASAAGFNLGRKTGERTRNLVRELARPLCWEAQGESGWAGRQQNAIAAG
jgi:hypothetical protein